MPSSDFQKICRDMHNLSDAIEIKSVGQQLYFSCKGTLHLKKQLWVKQHKVCPLLK